MAKLTARKAPKLTKGALKSVEKPALLEGDFLARASKGALRQAATPKQDLANILKKKVPAVDFEIGAGHPLARDYELGRLRERFDKAGLSVSDDRMGRVYVGRDQGSLDALLRADTAQAYGKAYGYSDEDIAAFYLKRRGGDTKAAFEEYVKDLGRPAVKAPKLTKGALEAPNPRATIGNNGGPRLSLMDVLEAKAKEMALKPADRIQPDPARTRLLDTDYKTRSPGSFSTDLSSRYPRNPDPAAPLPKGDRARVLVDNREAIAGRLAEKIRAKGTPGTDVQYFYNSDGPIYRAARKAGLSHEEARSYLDDFSQYYAATSPRTDTEQNLRNATLAMAKSDAGIPVRQVMGPGTIDAKGNKGISEKGYPMMTGKGGIHGQLLDDVMSGRGIDPNTNPKPATFGGNMVGNLSGATADTHAIRGALIAQNELQPGSLPEAWIVPEAREAYRANPGALTSNMIDDALETQMIGPKGATYSAQTEYGPVADVYHSTARALGVEPAEAQSLGWFSLGDETNLGSAPKTVADLIDERINVTAKATGAPPEEIARLLFRRKIPLMGLGGAGILGAMTAQEDQRTY